MDIRERPTRLMLISPCFLFRKVKDEIDMDDANHLRFESEKLELYYDTYNYKYIRDMSQRFELHPGTYCVIPTTFYKGSEAEFMLRIAADGPMQSR